MKENDLVQDLMWAALVGLFSLAATKFANRVAGVVWQRVIGTEPPRK